MPIWGGNGLSTSTCNSILQLFDGEKIAKAVRGSYAAAKAWLRGGFCPPKPSTPPKAQKLLFCIIPETVPQNRRATGARMGLVSKHRLVDIMLDFYAMSRCGLRKLLFSSNVQLLCVITQSTGHTFLPSLPIGKKLGSNSTFMFSKKTLCKV